MRLELCIKGWVESCLPRSERLLRGIHTIMKLQDLSDTQSTLSYYEVETYVKKFGDKIKGYSIDENPPYRINADKVDLHDLETIFDAPLPAHFGDVKTFNASFSSLLSLNQLHIDRSVRQLIVDYTAIRNFEGCPKVVELYAKGTRITSLTGISQNTEVLFISQCKELAAFDAPISNVKDIIATSCGISHLKDIHKLYPELETLIINHNPIQSHILGLLKIPKLTCLEAISYKNANTAKAFEILEKHRKSPYGNKRILECQSELLDNDLDEYAQL